MRLTHEWPDRVYVEKSHHEKMKELTSKESEAEREVPFKGMKEVLMASAMIGYNLGLQTDIKEKQEVIFTRYLDSQLDLPIVCCLAIAHEKDVDVINDKNKIIEIFQKYITGGFDTLYETINEGPDKIQSYAHYLLKNKI